MMRSWSSRFFIILSILCLLAPLAVAGDGASVTKTGSATLYEPSGATSITADITGRLDGDTLSILATGFISGETVQILLQHQQADGSLSGELASWEVVADAGGNINSLWLIDAGIVSAEPIVIKATGTQSGEELATMATETDSRLVIVNAPDTIPIGIPFDVTVLLEQNCCDGQFAPMPNRQVSFYANTGDCGVDPTDIPLATEVTDANGMATATLTIDSVGYFVIGVKYEGEAEPGIEDDPNSACFPDQRIAVLASIDCSHIYVKFQDPEIFCISGAGPVPFLGCVGGAICFPTTVHNEGAGNLVFSIGQEVPGSIDPQTGEVCLMLDTAGLYYIQVIATDSVGQQAQCEAALIVEFNQAPAIEMPEMAQAGPCYPETVCVPFDAFDIDGNIESVTSNIGTVDGDTVCVIIEEGGSYELIVTVTDTCGLTASATCLISAEDYIVPSVDLGIDQNLFHCETEQVCVPVTLAGLYETVLTNLGQYDPSTGLVCFTPELEGDYSLIVSLDGVCGEMVADTVIISITYNDTPTISGVTDTTFEICVSDSICIPLEINDPDNNIYSVVGNIGYFDIQSGLYCLVVDADQQYQLSIDVTDSCGLTANHTITITTFSPPPPPLELVGADSVFLCEPGPVCVDVITVAEFQSIETNLGYYDSQTGQICFDVLEPGMYILNVTVTDLCNQVSEASDTIFVEMNSAPTAEIFADTSFYLCLPEEICLPVDIMDVDGNIADISVSTGTYRDGMICFTPYNQGIYEFELTVTDECGAMATVSSSVTIITDQDIVLECPGDTTVYSCYRDTVYVPVGGIPDRDQITVSVAGLNAWWSEELQAVGVYTECSNSSHIIVSVETPCGTYDCEFDITVECNVSPLVLMPPDSTFFSCGSDDICIPVGVSDPNNNIDRVETNYGAYDPATGKVCFYADTAGVYTIVSTVYDDCGDSHTDQMDVTIVFNSAPTCVVPDDTSLFVCTGGEISLPVSATDPDFNLVSCEIVDGPGELIDGYWVYSPLGSGQTTVTISCVDSCGAICSSEFTVYFDINHPPVFNCYDFIEPIFVCDLSEYPLPPLDVYDAEGNITEVRITINDEIIPYIPDQDIFFTPLEGLNRIDIVVIDDCGDSSVCDMPMHFVVNSAPEMAAISDTSLFICDIAEVCYQLSAYDLDSNLADFTIIDGPGTIDGSHYCFSAQQAGEYVVTIGIADQCGETDTETFTISIQANQSPNTYCPVDTAVFVCDQGETIYIPGFIADDPDGNLISVMVNPPMFQLSGETVSFVPVEPGEYNIELVAVDECGDSSSCITTVIIEFNTAPTDQSNISDIDLVLCTPEEICRDLMALDSDGNFSHWELVDGPGSIVDDSWCFTPYYIANDSVVEQFVVIRGYDDCGTYCEIEFSVVWHLNNPPVAQDGFHAASYCYDGEFRILHTGGYDPDQDPLTFSLLGDVGSIDPITGDITYRVDTSGIYAFDFVVTDTCMAADTGLILDTIQINTPPSINVFDTTITLCDVEEICFEVTAEDIDGDDINFYQESGPGTYTVIGPYTIEQCFMPDAVDSATYIFEYCVSDQCGYALEGESAPLPCPCTPDTIRVTVLMNRTPEIECPDPQQFASCDPDTLEYCFPISYFDPDGDLLDIQIISGNAYIHEEGDISQICVNEDLTGELEVVVVATDNCGAADTCSIPVMIDGNDAPTIDMGTDFATSLCEPAEICFPISYFDPDGEVLNPQFNFGTLTDSGTVCFMADQPMTYQVIGTVTDSCGLTASDTINITVDFNSAPTVELGPDFETGLCLTTEICVTVDYGDVDDDQLTIVPNMGTFNSETGQVCFDISEAGSYELIVTVTDECEASAIDTVIITAIPGEPPYVSLGEDFEITLCELIPICVDVSVPTGLVEAIPNIGEYNPATGKLCFVPDTAGVYILSMLVTDSCELSSADTVSITVMLDQVPELTCSDPIEVTLCEPTEICFPFNYSDPEGQPLDVQILSTDLNYSISGDSVCFTADQAGEFLFHAQVTDLCGNMVECRVPIMIDLNSAPEVALGDNFSVTLCQPQTVCFSADIFDADGEILDILISLGEYDADNDRICLDIDSTGTYVVIAIATDSCGAMASDTTVIMAEVSDVPTLDLGDDFALNLCEPEEVCVDVITDATYQTITTNIGQYNVETKQVCFMAEASGGYNMVVEIVDSCGLVATDTVHIDVTVNTAPTLVMAPDTTVYLCSPEPICLPIELTDLENNIATIDVIGGTYNDGYICITPYDSGMYQVIMTVIDSCGEMAHDTTNITVLTDQGAQLVCPNDTTLFACVADTICLPLYGIPQEATVVTSGINTWYDAQSGTICFFTECGNVNNITVEVTTPCGVYECAFTVTVECNIPPLVLLPPDTSMMICGPEEVCLPVGVSDVNNNLYSVIVDGGWYDAAHGIVCFDADTSGTYTIIVTAEDSCGETTSDEINAVIDFNTAPYLSYEWSDTLISTCVPEVCIPITAIDADDNLVEVLTSWGTYNEETGEICITVDTNGIYCVEVYALDSCGLADTLDVCVDIETGDFVYISCPPEIITGPEVCGPSEVCVDVEIIGSNYEILTSLGEFVEEQLCFFADTAGIYTIEMVGVAECNTDSCVLSVEVLFPEQTSIACVNDTLVLLCEFETLCFPFETVAADEVIAISTPSGAYIENGQVCVPLNENGDHNIMLVATSECSADTCEFIVTSILNSTPVLVAGNDTTLIVCEPYEICVDFELSDIDNNIIEVMTNLGDVVDDQVCFIPDDFGVFNIVITARDECGDVAADTVTITVNQGGTPLIICPGGIQYDTLCAPDTVCILVPISPVNAEVTISPEGWYSFETGEVCVEVVQSRTIDITVTAEATCGVDSCEFTIDVIVDIPPTVSCVGQIDTLLCLSGPTTLCYPVTLGGTVLSVETSLGSYANGEVCLEIDEPGAYVVALTAHGICVDEVCTTVIQVTKDQDPVLNLPVETLTFERCPDDSDLVCIDGIWATDVENDVTLTQTCGIGDFELITSDSGKICFLPPDMGTYEFCFEAFDGCNTTTGSFFVEILEEEDCDVCIYVGIESGECTPVGLLKDVQLTIDTDEYIGGFDLLISLDASVMSFTFATIEGTAIHDGSLGWEYFDYRLNSANCAPSCPSGLVRFVGIADINNGPSHPPHETMSPNGVLVNMQFQVANDQNLGDQFLPITFVWYDCGDNSFSDTTGNELYVDVRIYNYEGSIRWDENDDVNYPESSRPFGLGATDECFGDGKVDPIRCIEFYHGGICVIHPDSIDARGDINLNGIAYEIADAVVYSNYFIYGLEVFVVSIPGQIAASDVNADGVTLSVADLVLLIRVIVGDANPIPKVGSFDNDVLLTTETVADGLEISTRSPGEIGAALFVFDLEGDVAVGDPTLAEGAGNMDLVWSIQNGQLRMLVMNMGAEKIKAGLQDIINVPYEGEGSLVLSHSEIVDYQGRSYNVAFKDAQLPMSFSLGQNYPNPFNPNTTIEFSLPQPSEWTLRVYNVAGKLVRIFEGDAPAGYHQVSWDSRNDQGAPVASGIYFYRLDTENHSQTKKMMLLK